MSFVTKKIGKEEDYITINDELFFFSPVKETSFGKHQSRPRLQDLIKYLGEPVLYYGAVSYNSLGFSCQVPATVTFLVDEKYIDFFKNLNYVFNFSRIIFIPCEYVRILKDSLSSMIMDCYFNDLYTYHDQYNGSYNDLDKIVSDKISKLEKLCGDNNINWGKFEENMIQESIAISNLYSYLETISFDLNDGINAINYRYYKV